MRSKRYIVSILWAIAVGATALLTGATPARAAKVDRHLKNVGKGRPEMVDIIVQTRGRPTFKHRTLVGAFGGEAGLPFTNVDAFAARVPSPALKGLAHNPHFINLSIDAPVQALWDRNAVRPPVGVPEAFAAYGVTGAGVGVAIVDSGAANHEDFGNGSNSSVRGFVDFLSTTGKTQIDPYGHGSHVAGIISGNGSAVPDWSDIRCSSRTPQIPCAWR
jgi:serine protease AprX